jgi:hypothetical protein
MYVFATCSVPRLLDRYSVSVHPGAEVASSFPPNSGAVVVPSSQQQQQTPSQPSVPLLSSPPAITTGRPWSWTWLWAWHCPVREEVRQTGLSVLFVVVRCLQFLRLLSTPTCGRSATFPAFTRIRTFPYIEDQRGKGRRLRQNERNVH